MKAVKVAVMGLILGTVGIASAKSCPDLSGTWQGACNSPAFYAPMAEALGGLGLQGESTVTIKQGLEGQYLCEAVELDGQQLPLGGIESKVISTKSALLPVMGLLSSAHLTATSLKTRSVGIIQIGEGEGSFSGEAVYSINSKDELVVEGIASLSGEAPQTVQCTYKRM